MTNQPSWLCIANLGDVSPIEYGGYFVHVDTTGVYAPEAEYLYAPDSDTDGTGWELYRFSLDRCTYVNGILSDNRFHPEHPAWFADDLQAVADCCGADLADLITDLTSDNPLQLAQAYRLIGDYHGYVNLDGYPQTFGNRFRIERFARKYRTQWETV